MRNCEEMAVDPPSANDFLSFLSEIDNLGSVETNLFLTFVLGTFWLSVKYKNKGIYEEKIIRSQLIQKYPIQREMTKKHVGGI